MTRIMDTPRVSVLMPAFNAACYVDRAIASVLAQSYTDWELVAIDDGSIDETWALLTAWATRDPRIRVFRNDRNEGLGPVRGRCLDLARGDYAGVMDSDDVALPSWLAQRVSLLDTRPGVVLASGPLQIIGEREEYLDSRSGEGSPLVLKWRLLFGNPIHHPSSVFRTPAAREVGGYKSQPYLEDWSLCARISEVGQVVQEGAPQMKYRIRPESTSARLGPDRCRLETVARNIMVRNLQLHAHLDLPASLAWYLYRGRFPFKGDPNVSKSALRFLREAYTNFTAAHAGPPELAAAFLDDAANVLRTGGWTLQALCESVSVAIRPFGLRALLHRACLVSILKGLLLPLTIRYRFQYSGDDVEHGNYARIGDEGSGASAP